MSKFLLGMGGASGVGKGGGETGSPSTAKISIHKNPLIFFLENPFSIPFDFVYTEKSCPNYDTHPDLKSITLVYTNLLAK